MLMGEWMAHMTDTTLHQSWQSSPLPDHAESIPVLFIHGGVSLLVAKGMFFVNFK
jgi:hypothetical protein